MFEIIEDGVLLDENVQIGNYVIIKKGAKIGKNTIISDYTYIDSNVVIGQNNYIGTGVIIKGNVQIGDNNHILDQTIIGLSSKHIGYHFYQERVLNSSSEYDTVICTGCCLNGFVSVRKGCELVL